MRELKFRAWDTVSGEWVETINIRGEKNSEFNIYSFPITPAEIRNNLIIEQYTGLKDKNGKEIYEGDIVKIYKGRKLDSVLLVQFDELNGEYMWCKNEDIDSAEYGGYPYWAKYSVIGNIHENPELVKEEDNGE